MSGSCIGWATCKSAPRSRQITTPAPHHSVFYRPDALVHNACELHCHLPFWYWLTWVVLDKRPLNMCVCVCVQLTYCVDFSVATVNCVMVHNRCSIGVTMLSLKFNPQLFPTESRLVTHTYASVHQHKLVSANDHKAQKLRR